jgi:transcription initiation factor TFIIIB Brf1 subunit/transcription initiation factor TFIIB
MNHRDRALYHAYVHFDSIGKSKMGLKDSIVDQAKIVYKKFNEDKLTRGAIRTGIKAHCLLYACKSAGVSRSLQEVADAFDIPVKDVSRTTEMFRDVIGGSGTGSEASDLVCRVFGLLEDFPNKRTIKMKTIQECIKARENPRLMAKTPKGILSAVMYKTIGGLIEREVIANVCEVSVPTLIKIEKLL